MQTGDIDRFSDREINMDDQELRSEEVKGTERPEPVVNAIYIYIYTRFGLIF